MIATLRSWTLRRRVVALASAAAFVVLVAVPTDLIDTPVFSREIPPTWWAWPSLGVSALLGGLLVATYVASGPATLELNSSQGARRGGWIGGALTYFAVGCPVCNKLVLLALGSTGAITWFEPFQPVLQVAAIFLLFWALRGRLKFVNSCPTNLTTGDLRHV